MNTPIPVKATDGTLNATPHIVAVLVGGIVGFLSTKLPFLGEYSVPISIGLTTVLTTAVHFVQAKLAE
jgi:hypothetical protein